MKTLKCPHCNETWEYKGLKKVYTNCPDCRKMVHVINNRVKEVTAEKTSAALYTPLVSEEVKNV
jgi:acetyl-CoA carboxylase beta subunit